MVALVALVYAAISLRRGPVFSADSSTYSRWADQLIASGFNYGSWSAGIESLNPLLAYAGWVTIVALNKLALGAAWTHGILLFNLVLAIAVVGMGVALISRLTSSRVLVAAACVAFLAAFELWLWIPYVLSDVSFMFLCFVVFYVLCKSAGQGGGRARWRQLTPLALGALALVYRPAGLPIALLVVIATVFHRRLWSVGIETRILIARWAALGLVVLIAVAVVLDSILMANPEIWPFRFLSGLIHEFSQEYRQGIVVYGRPDTYHASSSGLLAYVWLNIDRLRWFFAFSAQGFSRGHNVANVTFFVPVYLGWLAALVSLMRSRSDLSWAMWWTTALGTLFVVLFWVFHSLQYIDYDWRYRLPCLPVLVVLAAIGWHELIRGGVEFGRARFAGFGS